MKTIPLTQGKHAIVDDADFEFLSQWKWCASNAGNNSFYAVSESTGVKRSMQRVLLDAPKGLFVDHANLDTLDNRRSNLRLATLRENTRNSRLSKRNKSGFKGVAWSGHKRKLKNPWRVDITADGDHFFLGMFSGVVEAAKRYDVAARLLHGEFARLNFPLITNQPENVQ